MENLSGFMLNGKIAISVADSKDLDSLGLKIENFNRLVIELSRCLIDVGGRLIYGGKMGKGDFTERFRDFANQYAKENLSKDGVKYITNFFAWPYYNRLSNEEEDDYLSSRMELVNAAPSEYVLENLRNEFVRPINDDFRFLYATSMTAMRIQAEKEAEARILIGGKMTGFSGCMLGIVEEFLIAKNNNHPLYLIGGFGGATKVITQIIEKCADITSERFLDEAMTDPQYKFLFDYYKDKGLGIDYSVLDTIKLEDLDNGLTEEQNLRLFHSTNSEEIIELVLLGLKMKLYHS